MTGQMRSKRFRWSWALWWACQDLNLGPHPYQGSAPGLVSPGWDLRRAQGRVRPYALRRRGTRRPSTGWDALTPTELTVAGLVAEGHSNPDIAGRLVLSRRTVDVHVSHILAKLGVRSRVDIAREAFKHPAPTRSA